MLNRLYLSYIARFTRSFGRSIPTLRYSAALFSGKSFDEAWEQLDNAGKAMMAFSESYPSTPKVAVFKGAACLGSGAQAYEIAYTSFGQALEMQADCTEALVGRAITEEIAEQYDRARSDLSRAYAIDKSKTKETYEKYIKLVIKSYSDESKAKERVGKLLAIIVNEVDKSETATSSASNKYHTPQAFRDHYRTPPTSDSDNGIYILK
jgi:hypothetical protein